MESVHLHLNDLFEHAQGGSGRNDGGTLGNGGYCIITLTPTTVQDETANEMWNKYLEEIKELDKASMDAWREDSNGVIVLVSQVPIY